MLHAASAGGEVKIIKYLLEKEFDINKVDNVSDSICLYC